MAGVRERILSERRALAPAEHHRLSTQACARAIAALEPVALRGLRVALYRPLPGELALASLEHSWVSAGARLHYPRIIDRTGALMEFVEVPGDVLGEDESWAVGSYGIREPKPRFGAVDPLALDLLLVPGVAYTPSGLRLGMGAGFYDRFLPGTRPEAVRLALAFDFQVVSVLEQRPWDQPVHWVLTETRDLRAASLLIEKLFAK